MPNKENETKTMPGKETDFGKRSRQKLDMKTLKRLLSYLKAYKGTLILVTVCILLSALAGAASSMFLQSLIDDYITPLLASSGTPDYSGLIKALTVMAVIYLVGALSTYLYNRQMVTAAQGTLKTIRDEMFEKMQKLPIRYFDSHTHGDIMSLYTNDTDALRQMIAQSMAQLISSAFTITAVFVCMLNISIWLTIVVLVVLFLVMQFAGIIMKKSGRYFMAQQKTLADLDGYIEEMINGQKVIKVFCHEGKAREEMVRRNKLWEENSAKANGHGGAMMPLMNALGYIQYVIVAVFGAYLAIAKVPNLGLTGFHTMTVGMIASFLTLSRNFTQPISQISNQYNSIVTALAGASRIFTFMDEAPETDEGYVTLVNAVENEDGSLTETGRYTGIWAWKHPHHDGTVTYTRLRGEIVLDHVDFGYNPDKEILHDITLYANPGEKVAFVGSTGAGKTTITNLINRFYDIADGKIRYDGININKIKKADLRRSLGMVLQDVNLFTGTIMENLRYSNPNATDEECIAAAKLANADSFIRMLPDGYNTVLKGDGSGLSQGQRQLISIARAAVSNPPVMILDEATSSIDTRTEALVQNGMDKLMQGRTVFVIAHRLSTVQNSDVIMVLDHGRIIERGSHEKLIAEKGTYYQLYTGAFDLE
jgi:ATP-binding cassette subfamily B multidrug efflux pump